MIIILAFIFDHQHGQHGYLLIMEQVTIISIPEAKIIFISLYEALKRGLTACVFADIMSRIKYNHDYHLGIHP